VITLANSDNERNSILLNSSVVDFSVRVDFLVGQEASSHTRLCHNRSVMISVIMNAQGLTFRDWLKSLIFETDWPIRTNNKKVFHAQTVGYSVIIIMMMTIWEIYVLVQTCLSLVAGIQSSIYPCGIYSCLKFIRVVLIIWFRTAEYAPSQPIIKSVFSRTWSPFALHQNK